MSAADDPGRCPCPTGPLNSPKGGQPTVLLLAAPHPAGAPPLLVSWARPSPRSARATQGSWSVSRGQQTSRSAPRSPWAQRPARDAALWGPRWAQTVRLGRQEPSPPVTLRDRPGHLVGAGPERQGPRGEQSRAEAGGPQTWPRGPNSQGSCARRPPVSGPVTGADSARFAPAGRRPQRVSSSVTGTAPPGHRSQQGHPGTGPGALAGSWSPGRERRR